MLKSGRALFTTVVLSFALVAWATTASRAREVEVTVPAEMVIQGAAYPDGNGCVDIAHVMWKHDPNAGTSAVVHWGNIYDQHFDVAGEEPFDDSDTWLPGLTFRVPAGYHWIRVGADYQVGEGATDFSEMVAKTKAYVKGPYTVTYTTIVPDPAIITPLGRTVNLDKKHRAALAIVACPWDGAGACSVKFPRHTYVRIRGTKYRLSVTGPSTVKRGKSATVYVEVSERVQKALKGRTIHPKVRITATKPGTKPTHRTADRRSIRIR